MKLTCYRCHQEYRDGACGCQDGITLVWDDCKNVLPELPEGSVDLVLTDPPYGIAAQFGEIPTTGGGHRRLQFEWDGQAVVDDVRIALTMAFQTCKKRAACFVWVGFDTAERYAEPARRAGFTIKPAAWVKKCPPPPGNGNWWPSAFELAYYGYRGAPYFADKRSGRNNVWVADSYRHGKPGKNGHPTQKPLHLIREHVAALASPDSFTLDPFAGSGTTGVACRDVGRRCLMIEIEQKYCEIAAQRLRQKVLF